MAGATEQQCLAHLGKMMSTHPLLLIACSLSGEEAVIDKILGERSELQCVVGCAEETPSRFMLVQDVLYDVVVGVLKGAHRVRIATVDSVGSKDHGQLGEEAEDIIRHRHLSPTGGREGAGLVTVRRRKGVCILAEERRGCVFGLNS